MAQIAQHPQQNEPELAGYTLNERSDLLAEQADELTAQAKAIRVLDWTVRSVCDPHSLVH
ncbi:MAG TPA: hypothetical protein PK359_15040 [Burkholderiaceae bacterium]|nr:hypothetical protein [Burkholderiaceae bacterium]